MQEDRVRIGRIFKDDKGVPCLRKSFTDAAAQQQTLYIPVSAILEEVDNGATPKSLKKKFNNCRFTQDDIRACRAFAAVSMPNRREYKRNARERRMKILLDENMPYQLIMPLLKKFGGLTHIYFEEMAGFTDEFIYYRPFYHLKKKSLTERKKDIKTRYIIFTRDRDLVDIAREQWLNRIRCSATPEDIRIARSNIIIHVQDMSFGTKDDTKHLVAMADKILQMIESKEACAYAVTKGGVHPIKSCRMDDMIKRVDEEARRKEMISAANQSVVEERKQLAAGRLNRGRAKRGLQPV